MHVAPFGSWESPLDAATVSGASLALADVLTDHDDVYWIEGRPEEGGRQVVVRWRDGSLTDVTPGDVNARTRVHEYGGASFTVANGAVWFSGFEDQRLWRIEREGEPPVAVTPEGPWRYADGRVTPDGGWVVCVREAHPPDGKPSGVVNELVAVSADGSAEAIVLASGRDFYAAPRLSPDSSRIAWIEWDFPQMPWDETELKEAAFELGRLTDVRSVAGGTGESVQQPAWDAQGRLLYISDASGWWNVHRDGEGALHDDQADVGLPSWYFGMSSMVPLDDGRILVTRVRNASHELCVLEEGTLSPVSGRRAPEFNLAASGTAAFFIGASPTDAPAVVRFDLATGEETVLRAGPDPEVDESYISRGEHITASVGDGEQTHGLFYPPANPEFTGPDGELPPLVVKTHGGPTAHVTDDLNLDLQFWTTRGFAVIDVNYRGSTGYGREYRMSLDGRWGLTDVEDVVAMVEHLVAQGRVDADRVAIRGGSAGGYTTLRALTSADTFSAGASYFGVADVGALARDTHKFESRYMERLMPPDQYDERSPIHHVDQLSTPLLVLQGLEDEVVPPAQAEAMVAALDAKGVPHAYLPYEGEQHGFRKFSNQVHSLESELSFYGRVFGFHPADDLPEVDVRHADRLQT